MQTAEEILKITHEELSADNPKDWKTFDAIMNDGTGAAMIKAMQEYARQACEEQKKICADAYMNETNKFHTGLSAILNAPLPELK